MSWRPIDLAPRDGARIVVAFRSTLTNELWVSVAAWSDDAWRLPSETDPERTTADIAIAWTELPTTPRSSTARDHQ